MGSMMRLRAQKLNPPAPTLESFKGKTVLVTGTTSGLGLEAVKKLAWLDASRLIITARSMEKGEQAKLQIQEHVRRRARETKATKASDTEIIILTLDMSTMAGVKKFASTLEKTLNGSPLDAAILNAGVTERSYQVSPDGFEQTIQVNVVSTVLLAMLLLPLLISTSEKENRQTHLTFISSGTITQLKEESFEGFLSTRTPIRELSKEENYPPGKYGGTKQYPRSKLMVEHSMRHIAKLPEVMDAAGQPKVIVNSACPGLCKSDLGRQYKDSLFVRLFVWIVFFFFARSASEGANSYVSALLRDGGGSGQLWKDDHYYAPGDMVTSEAGKKFGEHVWHELKNNILKF